MAIEKLLPQSGSDVITDQEGTESVGNVILLSVGPGVSELLGVADMGQLCFHEMTSANQMFYELQLIKSATDAMVLGVQLKEPVRIAQRIHSMGKDIPIVILTEPERHEHLKQA